MTKQLASPSDPPPNGWLVICLAQNKWTIVAPIYDRLAAVVGDFVREAGDLPVQVFELGPEVEVGLAHHVIHYKERAASPDTTLCPGCRKPIAECRGTHLGCGKLHPAEDTDAFAEEGLSATERKAHLAALVLRWGHTDEEVVALAEKGELPRDADHDVWLILLGRGDLIDG